MKWLTGVLLFLFFASFVNCKSRVSRFYGVHEDIEYLNIEFNETNIKPQAVLFIIDSILSKDSSQYEIIRMFHGDSLNPLQRILHFKAYPEEYYRVYVNSTPCWIMSVFNQNIDRYNWLYNSDKLGNKELNRIEKRFKVEILSKCYSFHEGSQ